MKRNHTCRCRLAEVRKNNTLSYLRPDGKSQVTVEYDNGKPIRVDTIVLSTQHSPDVELKQIKKDLMEHVIKPVAGKLIDEDTKYHINPTGRFVQGGPPADCGLTGRKIIVDTYGGWGRHGGGCFSGKDPSKVDRSGAYMARYIAKNIVASGLADRCEVQIAYAIGVAEPVSVFVDTNGTGKIADEKITELVKQNFDLKPAAIIKKLDFILKTQINLEAMLEEVIHELDHDNVTVEGFQFFSFTWEQVYNMSKDRESLLR